MAHFGPVSLVLFKGLIWIPCSLNGKQKHLFSNCKCWWGRRWQWPNCILPATHDSASPALGRAKQPFPGAFLVDLFSPLSPFPDPRRQRGNKWTSQKQFQLFKRNNWLVTAAGNCAISTTGQCQQALNACCYGNPGSVRTGKSRDSPFMCKRKQSQ